MSSGRPAPKRGLTRAMDPARPGSRREDDLGAVVHLVVEHLVPARRLFEPQTVADHEGRVDRALKDQLKSGRQ
jgi:hypothetical protein